MSYEEKANDLITIVVPTKNCERTIDLLMESLSRLRGSNFEVVVVDNSVDRTPDIVAKYPFVRLIRVSRSGLNYARNVGIRAAKGSIIAFTDGDCAVTEDWILNIKEAMKKGYAVVGGSVKLPPEVKANVLMEYAQEGFIPIFTDYSEEIILTKDNFFKLVPFMRPPSGNNLAFKREVLEEVGLFDEEYRGGYDEVDLEWRICERGYRILCTPKIIVYHYHRNTLRALVKQVHGYGRGHFLFLKKHKKPSFLRMTYALFLSWIGAITVLMLPVCFALSRYMSIGWAFAIDFILFMLYSLMYKIKRRIRLMKAMIYSALDLVVSTAYILGFIREALRGA